MELTIESTGFALKNLFVFAIFEQKQLVIEDKKKANYEEELIKLALGI